MSVSYMHHHRDPSMPFYYFLKYLAASHGFSAMIVLLLNMNDADPSALMLILTAMNVFVLPWALLKIAEMVWDLHWKNKYNAPGHHIQHRNGSKYMNESEASASNWGTLIGLASGGGLTYFLLNL